MTMEALYALCVGAIGIQPSEFWQMESWEVQAAIKGYSEHIDRQTKNQRAIVFGASRFNAAATAMSKKQAQKVSAYKFDWEKAERKAQTKKEMQVIFKALAQTTAKK